MKPRDCKKIYTKQQEAERRYYFVSDTAKKLITRKWNRKLFK